MAHKVDLIIALEAPKIFLSRQALFYLFQALKFIVLKNKIIN